MAPTFVFLVAGITVPGFVVTDSFVPVVGFRGRLVEHLDDLSEWRVSNSGARTYFGLCHILSRRSGLAGGGDGGIGLAVFFLLRLFL